MIVDDLDVQRVVVLPAEADPPLVVNADTVLRGVSAFELLEPIAGRHSEIAEGFGGIDGDALAQWVALTLRAEPPSRR